MRRASAGVWTGTGMMRGRLRVRPPTLKLRKVWTQPREAWGLGTMGMEREREKATGRSTLREGERVRERGYVKEKAREKQWLQEGSMRGEVGAGGGRGRASGMQVLAPPM